MYAVFNRADNGTEGVNFIPMYIDAAKGVPDAKQTGVAVGVMHSF